ncbi:S8 family serine peptidase [Candidatus Dependentiae bacterium]|nr:S8 family serine peptidase [Candidatus Dependentiae bacterium]
MKNFLKLFVMIIVFTTLCFNTIAIGESNSNYVKGEIIIKFKNLNKNFSPFIRDKSVKTGVSSIDILNKKFGVYDIEKVFKNVRQPTKSAFSGIKKMNVNVPDLFSIRILRFPKTLNPEDIASEYIKDPNVEYAHPNYLAKLYLTPNDPSFNFQWGLDKIKARKAWEVETGSPSVIVAVIDTGVDWNHPDLALNIWTKSSDPIDGIDNDRNGFIDDYRGWDFSDKDNDPMDCNGHGTHCSGIISAVTNNKIGVAGVCWNVKIMALKVFPTAKVSVMSEAIRYASDNGANILSNSWGFDPGIPLLPLIKDAIDYAESMGCIVVFASGNDKVDSAVYPAAYDPVIAVVATNQHDKKAPYSNYGLWVDISAPGGYGNSHPNEEDIYSTLWDDTYGYMAGTSMACPFISGVAALILSKNPNLSQNEVKGILYLSSDDLGIKGLDSQFGWGRVNAYNALRVEIQKQKNTTISSESNLFVKSFSFEVDVFNKSGQSLADGKYYVKEYEVIGKINFDKRYLKKPRIRIFSNGTDNNSSYNANKWSKVISYKKVTQDCGDLFSGCIVKTYVYYIDRTIDNQKVDVWFPLKPKEVKFTVGISGE